MTEKKKNAKNGFDHLNVEQLTKRRNVLKGFLIGCCVVWLGIFGLAIYFYVYKSTAKLFIPLAVLPATLLPIFISLATIDKEIKSRPQL
ncbi:hypothetical protein [Pedobacter sp. SYP-B3415]|uniref:hypothetical protein n=1 Tax=Pedobacter sp. SYP-B3415 TaxID=2496641 RepID=UPI00101CC8F0|nr:hypothetical protein [Pedobacter sp. SYP-B3415]